MSITIFKRSKEGRKGIKLPKSQVKAPTPLPNSLLRKTPANLPQVSELDVVRHYTNLSTKNFSIDKNFYPLGSCTMKYNPKIQERVGMLDGFLNLHPHHISNENEEVIQGALEVVYELSKWLCNITGMSTFCTSPQAGAHGEMLGIMMIHNYHKSRGNDKKRYVIVPDSSHGTNPATATMVGYEVITIKSDENGVMDFNIFKEKISDEVAAVMLTVPNTLGIFNPHIKDICDIAHKHDALMYYDGANMNAILGIVRPGDIGFDVMHINLHKTFATPHGGGGAGSGPVGVNKKLQPFLPDLLVEKVDKKYLLNSGGKQSIGKISPFFGNFAVSLRALTYMRILGKEGMLNTSYKSVLNANYLRVRLRDLLDLPYPKSCMHECVFSAHTLLKTYGVSAMDLAKYLIDFDLHAPTVYFPLIVKEALMIEPTETESKEMLDHFYEVIKLACELAKKDAKEFKKFPKTLAVSRPDDTKAIKQLDVCET